MESDSFEAVAHQAGELISAADDRELALRAVGGIGIWLRLDPELRGAYEGRRAVAKDIDLLAPRGSSSLIKSVFADSGWAPDERLIAWRGDRRHRYFRLDRDGEPEVEADVFLGKPPACHDFEVTEPGAIEGPAMGATDLALQKLQIVESGDRDLIDIGFLLLAHPPASGGGDEAIDSNRVAGVLARDWGFHHTATGNLERAGERAAELVGEERAPLVRERVESLRAAIDSEPKTRRWRLRARIGTRVQWYEDVEELDR